VDYFIFISDQLAEVFRTTVLYIIQCAEYHSAGHVSRQSDTFDLEGVLNWNTPICVECVTPTSELILQKEVTCVVVIV
jgi:hypothetical protein